MASADRLKVSIPEWNSDKEPSGFPKWSGILDGMVRACKGGSELVDYKNEKLGVVSREAVIVPSRIANDPDFQLQSSVMDGDSRVYEPAPKPIFSPKNIGKEGHSSS